MTDLRKQRRFELLNFRLWILIQLGILQPPKNDFRSRPFTEFKPQRLYPEDELVLKLQSSETTEKERRRLLYNVLFDFTDINVIGVSTGNLIRHLFPNPIKSNTVHPPIHTVGFFNTANNTYYFKGVGVMEPHHVELTKKLHRMLSKKKEWRELISGQFIVWTIKKRHLFTLA
jgi:hypothetical protein